ncbi:MAG TPA: hypothetical protein VIL35_01335 [Vicinamibacterales bacterium]
MLLQHHVPADDAAAALLPFVHRRRIADRVFRGALLFNAALTLFWAGLYATGRDTRFFGSVTFDVAAVGRVLGGVLFFYVLWGFVWYGVKAALLKYVAGFSKEERREAFSSRMSAPYDLPGLLDRHSERRIRIIDMIGRRGRFVTLACAGFYYLYTRVATEQPDTFATAFLADNLFDAVLTSWIFLSFYYGNNVLAAAFYGPQSRIMDGVLARANCLLITTLWTAFKFVLVPIGAQLAVVFPREQFAVVFGLIWGSYIVTDALAEIGGSIFGRQSIRVRGIGDVNRKSIGGTLTGFIGSLVFCIALVVGHGLPPVWLALAFALAISNTLLELYSPRGTDDFTMATANALLCWAFGALVLQ